MRPSSSLDAACRPASAHDTALGNDRVISRGMRLHRPSLSAEYVRTLRHAVHPRTMRALCGRAQRTATARSACRRCPNALSLQASPQKKARRVTSFR
eukprot:6198974-Pleurochrysis_carterae.AAC.2